MAITRASKVARTSSSANPTTQAVTVTASDRAIVLLLNVIGGTARAGGSPTFGGTPMTQASTTQIAAASPEASAEIWYVLNPLPGNYTISIPNATGNTIKYTVEAAQVTLGYSLALDAANGANGTGTNPSPGAITTSQAGGIAWAVVASGAQTWAPSSQQGIVIANTDDGNTGGGEQYVIQGAGNLILSWAFGTSEDYGAVVVAFKEVPAIEVRNRMRFKAGSGVSVTENTF
jgi:hypothetical protein